MVTNDTYTFVWMEQNTFGGGWLAISRECPRTGFKRSREYWADRITPASYDRLHRALLAMGGEFKDPIGAYEPEYGSVIKYVHRPQGAAMWFDLNYRYSLLPDTDWCANPYYPATAPVWDAERKMYVLRYAA